MKTRLYLNLKISCLSNFANSNGFEMATIIQRIRKLLYVQVGQWFYYNVLSHMLDSYYFLRHNIYANVNSSKIKQYYFLK